MRSVAEQVSSDLYLPQLGKIVEVKSLTASEKYFRLELERPLQHGSGQFVMVSVPGIGESAISITCGPRDDNILEMVIRSAGSVTQVIHSLSEGEYLGVRGPFGHGFPLDEFAGKDLLFIAGGLGLVPLRSLLLPIMNNVVSYGKVDLIVGSRTPAEVLFQEELTVWSELPAVSVRQLVDHTDHLPWDGEEGLVTAPISELALDPAKTKVVLCGPPVMYKFVLMELKLNHRIDEANIFVDLERRMKCGVGKCGHCQINQVYCCQEGPVFRYSELADYAEGLV